MHAIQELQKNRSEATALAAWTQIAPLAEFMAKWEPLFLQEHLKTFQGAIEGIAQQLDQRNNLRREMTD